MDEKLKKIASVLGGLSEEARLALIAELVPRSHAIVTKRFSPVIAGAFRDTATRLHSELKGDLRFDPRVIPRFGRR
jgi:hypothetical protein